MKKNPLESTSNLQVGARHPFSPKLAGLYKSHMKMLRLSLRVHQLRQNASWVKGSGLKPVAKQHPAKLGEEPMPYVAPPVND
jgi:hypothetical protein